MRFVYDSPLYRPPSEADSLILQVTLGCSHNRCAFCGMYRSKQFRAKSLGQIQADLAALRQAWGAGARRVFLADGDAMCLSARRLAEILDELARSFPRLQRVGIYANARDVLAKSDGELADLAARGLRIIYVGLESGDEPTLASIDKGATVDEIVEAVVRARAAGMAASVMVLLGIAGRERSLEHARASARAINLMSPDYTALLTCTPEQGTPLHERVLRGEFELPTAQESIEEAREFLAALRCETYFTCNHASNYLPLKGRLPEASRALLAILDAAIAGEVALKPEALRGL